VSPPSELTVSRIKETILQAATGSITTDEAVRRILDAARAAPQADAGALRARIEALPMHPGYDAAFVRKADVLAALAASSPATAGLDVDDVRLDALHAIAFDGIPERALVSSDAMRYRRIARSAIKQAAETP